MRRVCAAVLLVSCFSSDPGDRRFPCDSEHGCPPGQVCEQNTCEQTAAQTDAALPGDAGTDLATTPCSGRGYPIGTKGVWACLGTFSPAQPASSLCSNRKLCSDIALLVSAAECNTAKNPLVGVAGTGGTSSLANCAAASSGPGLLLYGCGMRSSVTKSEPAGNICRGFTMIHYPNADQFIYNNANYAIDAQTNLDNNAGVMCCP
jgi:hypothetical protein